MKFFSSLGSLYLKFPFIMSALIPATLTILGIVILSVKPADFSMNSTLATAIGAYATVLIVKTAVDYANAQKTIQLTKHAARLRAQIQCLDVVVSKKRESMAEVMRYSENKAEMLRRARGKLKFKRSAGLLNEEVCNAVISYLGSEKLKEETNFVCKILVPDEHGEFWRIGPAKQTGGTRVVHERLGLYLTDPKCLATRVWNDEGKHIASIPDTVKSEAKGDFIFTHFSQRENLRSICCYLVLDSVTDKPLAIWSIDADQPNVFPAEGSDKLMEINKIFRSFALRLSLEFTYTEILDETEEVYRYALNGFRR